MDEREELIEIATAAWWESHGCEPLWGDLDEIDRSVPLADCAAALAAIEASGYFIGRLEQVGQLALEDDEADFVDIRETPGRVLTTVGRDDDGAWLYEERHFPVFRKVVSGDENSGCDKRCSEMHTYEPPCEQAAPVPDAAGMRLAAGDENSGEPGGECATCGDKRVVSKWITHASEPRQPGDPFTEFVPCPDCAGRAPEIVTTDRKDG